MAEKEPLITFQLPEVKPLKVYALKRPDGSIIVRGEDELEETEAKLKEEWERAGRAGKDK